ncbi:MAG: hypothetical protein FGF48_07560 [Candidatus Brockarchaeota archaeon]|nr:hypothetical protein [Candidatus Brockarchaeota archaeon]
MMNKDLFEDTFKMLVKHAYKVRYVPHEVIEDYNATYNVIFKDKHIVTNAARELKIPLNEIWISEMWKSYEKYILFHELREIYHRANGMGAKEAHEKAVQESLSLCRHDSLFKKMIREIQNMDSKTAEKKFKNS